jgi:hypothetical protein
MITTNRAINIVNNLKDPSHRELLLSYAAGIIDGEGCIGIYPNSHNGNYQLRISVEMVQLSALKILHGLFGGKWYYKKAVKPRQARYTWMVFNRQAAGVCKELLPYLRIKNRNVNNVLKADWFSFYKRPITDKQQKIRKQVWLDNKEINKRGYYK